MGYKMGKLVYRFFAFSNMGCLVRYGGFSACLGVVTDVN